MGRTQTRVLIRLNGSCLIHITGRTRVERIGLLFELTVLTQIANSGDTYRCADSKLRSVHSTHESR